MNETSRTTQANTRRDKIVNSSTVRDFDHLKFMNEIVVKDEVLGKFLERCGDLETAVGKETMEKIKRSSNNNLHEPLSIREQLHQAMKQNPNRFYSNTNFQQLLA